MEASIRGIIKAVCISEKKGTEKHPVNEIVLKENFGIEGDAHAGKWHRQVSLLSAEKVDEFNARGGDAAIGAFGENILVSGIDFKKLLVGSIMRSGEVVMKLTQIGKECHSHCTIFARVGDCIMPREGVFATVEHGGVLRSGMELEVTLPAADAPLRAAVMTLSDKGAAGERVDTSGPRAAELLAEAGYEIVEQVLLPDAQKKIERELMRLADSRQVDLIITTGGTGLSLRDVTPEATMAVATRNVPGIAETIRAESLKITRRAMLSRGVSVVRGQTLIVNLPGSTKAVEEALAIVLPQLEHGLRILIRIPPHVRKRIDIGEPLKVQMGFRIGIHHARTCPDVFLQGVAHHQIQDGEDGYGGNQDSRRNRQDDFLFSAVPARFSGQNHPPSSQKGTAAYENTLYLF